MVLTQKQRLREQLRQEFKEGRISRSQFLKSAQQYGVTSTDIQNESKDLQNTIGTKEYEARQRYLVNQAYTTQGGQSIEPIMSVDIPRKQTERETFTPLKLGYTQEEKERYMPKQTKVQNEINRLALTKGITRQGQIIEPKRPTYEDFKKQNNRYEAAPQRRPLFEPTDLKLNDGTIIKGYGKRINYGEIINFGERVKSPITQKTPYLERAGRTILGKGAIETGEFLGGFQTTVQNPATVYGAGGLAILTAVSPPTGAVVGISGAAIGTGIAAYDISKGKSIAKTAGEFTGFGVVGGAASQAGISIRKTNINLKNIKTGVRDLKGFILQDSKKFAAYQEGIINKNYYQRAFGNLQKAKFEPSEYNLLNKPFQIENIAPKNVKIGVSNGKPIVEPLGKRIIDIDIESGKITQSFSFMGKSGSMGGRGRRSVLELINEPTQPKTIQPITPRIRPKYVPFYKRVQDYGARHRLKRELNIKNLPKKESLNLDNVFKFGQINTNIPTIDKINNERLTTFDIKNRLEFKPIMESANIEETKPIIMRKSEFKQFQSPIFKQSYRTNLQQDTKLKMIPLFSTPSIIPTQIITPSIKPPKIPRLPTIKPFRFNFNTSPKQKKTTKKDKKQKQKKQRTPTLYSAVFKKYGEVQAGEISGLINRPLLRFKGVTWKAKFPK